MPDAPARDFVGYANSFPQFRWPNGSGLALNLVINYEEGAERSPLDGEFDQEPLAESRYDVPRGDRELVSESNYEYGSRVGVWRALELMQAYEVPFTVFACGRALERNPTVSKALNASGCDFVVHGYRWLPPTLMSEDEQRNEIARCVRSISHLTEKRPLGAFIRPPNTTLTRRLLAEEGLLYDSGPINDDLPYFAQVDGRPFLIVPYTLDVNDIKFIKGQFFTADQFAEYAIDAFDQLWRESQRAPRLLSVGLHPRIIGRPGRLKGLERLLDHAVKHNVWIARRDDIALAWLDTFVPPDTWNWPSE